MAINSNDFRGVMFLGFQSNSEQKLDECQFFTGDTSFGVVSVKRLDWLEMDSWPKKSEQKGGFLKHTVFEIFYLNINIC